MENFTIFGTPRKRILFFLILAVAALLPLAAALRYNTPLSGLPSVPVGRLDSGWLYRDVSGLQPLAQLPYELALEGNALELVRDLKDVALSPGDVLVFQTRYQSIRMWADGRLIYEAAQGKEHALSSMWHCVASPAWDGASSLRVELVKYDAGAPWEIPSVLLDHPDAIRLYLFHVYMPAILVWLCCMLFTVLLVFILLFFLATGKREGMALVASLAAFIFLSGMWILLDCKVTTLAGGNYALTYFFSYCVFYLLPVPLLLYFQLILEMKSKPLRYLVWIASVNAGLWMLLHLLNLVSLRTTAITVHALIVSFVAVFAWEFFHNAENRRKRRLVYTFWGIVLMFAIALVSITLYYAGLLRPTNNAMLYAWALPVLILCMTMDAVAMVGGLWRERQYIQLYRQLAIQDSMTALGNRNAYELRLRELVADPPEELSFIIFDIDQMKEINDTYGHQAGDQAIALAAQCIREVFASRGDCYRIGGDEFCAILAQSREIPAKLRQFDELLQTRSQGHLPVRVSYGWETQRLKGKKTMADIVALKTAADKKLYREKAAHG